MIKVYLCGPISGKTNSECNEWRDTARQLLANDFEIVDPMARDFRGIEGAFINEIVMGDLADIDACECLLVCANASSWGTAMEVRHAFTQCKTIIAFTNAENSRQLSPWLRFHCNLIFGSLALACAGVKRHFLPEEQDR